MDEFILVAGVTIGAVLLYAAAYAIFFKNKTEKISAFHQTLLIFVGIVGGALGLIATLVVVSAVSPAEKAAPDTQAASTQPAEPPKSIIRQDSNIPTFGIKFGYINTAMGDYGRFKLSPASQTRKQLNRYMGKSEDGISALEIQTTTDGNIAIATLLFMAGNDATNTVNVKRLKLFLDTFIGRDNYSLEELQATLTGMTASKNDAPKTLVDYYQSTLELGYSKRLNSFTFSVEAKK